MRFLDTTKNQELDFSTSPNLNVISEQVKSGQYLPDTSSTFQIKTPDGQKISISGAELPSYLQSGSSFYTAEDARKEAEEKEFTSAPEQLKTAAESALSGATFGLSDVALQKTGLVDPERAQLRQQYNPDVALVGEIGGAVAPALLSGGAGLVGSATRVTPTALATTAGELAGKELAEFATRRITSPIAKKLAEGAVKTGAGSAIESALYGVGKGVSEAALGKPEATAENILTDIGTNAVLGGLLGGSLGAGTVGTGLVVKKGSEKINKVIGDAVTEKGKANLIARSFGANERQIKSIAGNDFKINTLNEVFAPALKGASTVDDFLDPALKKIDMDIVTQAPEVTAERVSSALGSIGDEIGEILKSSPDKVDAKSVIDTAKRRYAQLDPFVKNDIEGRKIKAFIDEAESSFTKSIIDKVDEKIENKEFAEIVKNTLQNEEKLNTLSSRLQSIPEMIPNPEQSKKARDNFLYADLAKTLDDAKKYQKEAVEGVVLLEKPIKPKAAKEFKTPEEYRAYLDSLDLFEKSNLDYKGQMAKLDQANKNLKKAQDQFAKLSKKLEGVDYGSEVITNPEYIKIQDEIEEALVQNAMLIEQAKITPSILTETRNVVRNVGREMSAQDFWNAKKFYDKKIYRDSFAAPKDTPYIDFITQFKNDLKDKTKDIIGSADTELLKKFEKANEVYSGLSTLDALVEHKIGKAANNTISLTDMLMGGVGAAAGSFGGALPALALGAAAAGTRKLGREYGDRGMLLILDKLEKKNLSIGKITDEAIDSLLKTGKKSITVGVNAGSREDKNKTYEEKLEGFTSQVNQIEEIKKNLDESLAPMALAAPETAVALRDKTINALDFLASKMPKSKSGVLREYKPSEGEIDKFNRYAVAIDNPKTIMTNLSSGYISPEEVEVLKQVYPELHSQLKEKAIEKLTDKQKKIPYQLRIQLQKLLDVKDDVNLQYQYTQALQASFAPGGLLNEQTMNPKIASGRADKTNFSKNQLSSYQSIVNRS